MELVISGDLENAELRLNDINLVPIQISYKLTEKKMIILDISALTPGEYILQIKKNDIIEKQKIFIP
jgi:flagellar motor switch/type III secretory pathway protein FliN